MHGSNGPRMHSPYLLQAWARGSWTIMMFNVPHRWRNVMIDQTTLNQENVAPQLASWTR
jgi:hypothetical protein